jgi:hypothetical protein
MNNKSIRWVLACLVLLLWPLWLWQEPLLARLSQFSDGLRSALPDTPIQAVQTSTPPRKCERAGGGLLYTTEDCPAGTRERGLQGGTVNVVAMPVAASPASAAASAMPLLRRLSGPQDAEAMRDKMMERAGAQ